LFNIEHKCRKDCNFKRHFIKNVQSSIEFSELDIDKIENNSAELIKRLESFGYFVTSKINKMYLLQKNESEFEPSIKVIGIDFENKDEQKSLKIIENSVVFSDSNYDRFEIHIKIFEKILQEISKTLNISDVKSIGLKKVNSIILTPLSNYKESFEFFKPFNFSILNSDLDINNAFKLSDQSVSFEEDNLKGYIKSSLKKLTRENSYKALIEFNLINNLCEKISLKEAIANYFKQLNDKNYDLFVWSLEQKMKNCLIQEETCHE